YCGRRSRPAGPDPHNARRRLRREGRRRGRNRYWEWSWPSRHRAGPALAAARAGGASLARRLGGRTHGGFRQIYLRHLAIVMGKKKVQRFVQIANGVGADALLEIGILLLDQGGNRGDQCL